MARFSRLEVLGAMLSTGLVPVFYSGNPETARRIVAAAADGGARTIEFTNRGDLAYRVFCELIDWTARERAGVGLGGGSVMDGPTASLYVNSGANFVVGPNLSAQAARVCNRRQVAYVPGCGSVTEISRAQELGSEIVKVFPGGQVGGPAFCKAVLGPMPWTRIMPTGGVSPAPESVGQWIAAGAACLGMGSELIRKDLVAAGDFAGIAANVAECLALIRQTRQNLLRGQ
jgi:2-dehydro-3-deoxyphosphogluconate aldolase / (4S)-4-hydroxy-2-oxoglutarate aldolase